METKEDSNINSTENEQKDNKFIYIDKNGIYLTKNLNLSKDKLFIKLITPDDKKHLYSNEFTYENLTQVCPLFSIEENIEGIDKLISESINSLGITVRDDNNDKILITQISVNSKIREIKLKLNQKEISEEELINSLTEKINNLLNERKEVYGVKSFKQNQKELDIKKEKYINKLNELELKLNTIDKRFNTIKEVSLLANSHIISDSEQLNIIMNQLKEIEIEDEDEDEDEDKDKDVKKNKKKKKDLPKVKRFLTQENIVFKLVYRASRDGDSAKEFHKRCDNIGRNITFILTDKNIKFGGFTNQNWEVLKKSEEDKKEETKNPDKKDDKDNKSNEQEIEDKPEKNDKKKGEELKKNYESEEGVEKEDLYAFCFSLTKNKIYPHNSEEEEKKGAIFCCENYGPTFSDNIFYIKDKMLTNGGCSGKVERSNYDNLEKDFDISEGEQNFNIKELEVFEIIIV